MRGSQRLLAIIEGCLTYNDIQTNLTCNSCAPGYTLIANATCMVCQPYCETCSFNIQNFQVQCTKCQKIQAIDALLYEKRCYYQSDWINGVILFSRYARQIICPSSCLRCVINDGTYKCTQETDGYFSFNGSSLHLAPCKGNCTKCSTDGLTCLQCSPYYLLFDNQCVRCSDKIQRCRICTNSTEINCNLCSVRYYLDNNTCKSCMANCLSCINETYCFSCNYGWILYYHSENLTRLCIPCVEFCAHCVFESSSIVCLQCYPGYFLDSTIHCFACSSNCQTCLSSTICTSCFGGYKLLDDRCFPEIEKCALFITDGTCYECFFGYAFVNGTCVYLPYLAYSDNKAYVCRENQYLENFMCENATVQVDHCIQYNAQFCIKCEFGYYAGYSSSSISANTTTCLLCPSGCKSCLNPVKCNSCVSGYYLEMYNPVNSCQACQLPCKACYTQKNLCLSCIEGYTLTKSMKCVGIYRFNFKLQIKRTFETIAQTINQIYKQMPYVIGNKTMGEQDQVEMVIQSVFSLINIQKASTESTFLFYQVSRTNLSQLTAIYNQMTSSVLIPTSIDGNQLLSLNRSELMYCGIGQETIFNQTDRTYLCLPIQFPNCHLYEDFNDNGVTCKVCDSGFSLTEDGKYCTLDCIKVGLSHCNICHSLTSCIKCSKWYFLDSLSNDCIPCNISHCTECQRNQLSQQKEIKCLKCQSGVENFNLYKIINNTCSYLVSYLPTPEGTAMCGQFLIKCMQGCIECYSPYSCESCGNGYFMMVPFKQNQSYVKYICVRCINNCKTCQNEHQCLSCLDGFAFDPETQTCHQCSQQNCLECSINRPNQCTKCMEFYYLSEIYTCKQCPNGCRYCNLSTNCFQCQPGYTLLNSSSNQTTCVQCISNQGCALCSKDVCLGCHPGFMLLKNQFCQKCVQNCWSCSFQNECTQCLPGFRLLNNLCFRQIQNCHIYNQTDGNCQSCYFGYVSQNASCLVKESQSSNTQIYPCDSSNFLQTGTNCSKCLISDPNCQKCIDEVCLECRPGFYIKSYNLTSLTQSFCNACSLEGCKKCHSQTMCIQCNASYFMRISNDIYGNLQVGSCKKCDQNCLTCYNQSDYCTSCESPYLLGPSRKCLGGISSGFILRLNIDKQDFILHMNQFLSALSDVISSKNQTQDKNQKLIRIKSITSGSTVVEGQFRLSSNDSVVQTVTQYNALVGSGEIMNISILSGSISSIIIESDKNKIMSIAAGSVSVVLVGLLVAAVIFVMKKRKQLVHLMQKKNQNQKMEQVNRQTAANYSSNSGSQSQVDRNKQKGDGSQSQQNIINKYSMVNIPQFFDT